MEISIESCQKLIDSPTTCMYFIPFYFYDTCRPYLYSRYWTGTSLQLRPMPTLFPGSLIPPPPPGLGTCREKSLIKRYFIHLHLKRLPTLLASSSPITIIRSPLLGACNSHNKQMQMQFYRLVYF